MDSPKTRFLKTPHASQLVELVEHPAFIAGCDAALLEMTLGCSFAENPNRASEAFYRVEGARLFIAYLTSIGRADKPAPKRTMKENLEP